VIAVFPKLEGALPIYKPAVIKVVVSGTTVASLAQLIVRGQVVEKLEVKFP